MDLKRFNIFVASFIFSSTNATSYPSLALPLEGVRGIFYGLCGKNGKENC
jgi:hypothetical protein